MNLKLDWYSRRAFQSIAQRAPMLAQRCFWWSGLLVLSCSASILPASAAERLTLKIGPFEQSISVEDLEKFAKTGELAGGLKPYASLLTPQVQQLLTRRLQLDPKLADKFVDDLLRSPSGNDLIDKIRTAIPNSSIEQVRGALALAVRGGNGLSAISFLRAYPGENITLDASSALGMALEFNPSYLKSQALGPLLERELNVEGAAFNAPFDAAAPGEQKVQEQTLTLQDKQRDRAIPVNIYWAENTNGPLVVLSHGFAADRNFLDYLARHLASHGLTVAALDHPGSNATWIYSGSIGTDPSSLLAPSEFVDRPKDVSFLLDELAKMNQQPGVLQGKLNTQQVTALGHSLGGYTVLALAGGELNIEDVRQFCKQRNPLSKLGGDWLQCAAAGLKDSRSQLRDRRIVQAIALNPLVGQLFGKNGLSQISTSTLILSSTDDVLTPALTHQLRPFTQIKGSKYLLTAIGATHLSISKFAAGSSGEALTKNTLVNERVGKVAEPLQQLLKGVTLAFIKQTTPEAKTYQPFLTSAYAQSLSTEELPLRLNAELPTNVSRWLDVASAINN